MSVRYVLTAVLPRYTMRRPPRPDRPARALVLKADSPDEMAEQIRALGADADGDDARVMGHN